MVTLTIDDRAVTVPQGSTILSACDSIGLSIPTLCFLETLKPVNVCRLCVVEIEGARVLAPACSRAVEPGMVVHTRSPRVMHSRKLVLELLASSVDLSTAPGLSQLLDEYACRPERFGSRAETVAQRRCDRTTPRIAGERARQQRRAAHVPRKRDRLRVRGGHQRNTPRAGDSDHRGTGTRPSLEKPRQADG